MSKTVKVKAKPGLQVHFPRAIATSAGARTRVLEGDEVIEVPLNMRFVRRRLVVGDLIKVAGDVVESKPKAAPKASSKSKSKKPKED